MGVGVFWLESLILYNSLYKKTTPYGVVLIRCFLQCYRNVNGLLRLCYEPLTHFWLRGCAVFDGDHFTLSAQ